jgi:cytochrome c-type biogenesis protein CcmH
MSGRWRWLPWIGLVVVAVAALVIGTHRSSHPTVQAETMHIAGQVRCPVCEGQSAAESQAPASVQIRNQIQQELQAGEHQNQILAGLVASYGPGILENPEARGVGLVVWVLPMLAVIAAASGLVLAFARWRPRPDQKVSEADRSLVDRALGGGSARGEVGEEASGTAEDPPGSGLTTSEGSGA